MFFALVAGAATGMTVAIELNRVARGLDHYPLYWEALFSAIRGIAFGLGMSHLLGIRYGAIFAILITLGQTTAYFFGVRASIDSSTSRKPRFTRRQFRAMVMRILGFIVATLICSALVHHVDHPWAFPSWGPGDRHCNRGGHNHQPIHRILCGSFADTTPWSFWDCPDSMRLSLQSLQYWVSLLDIRLT